MVKRKQVNVRKCLGYVCQDMMIQSGLFENCRRISRKSQPSSKRDWDMLWRLVKQNRLETKRIYMNSLRNYERDHTKTVLRTTCQSKFPPKNLKTWTFGLDLRRIDRSLRTRYAVRFFRHFAFTCLPFFVTLFQVLSDGFRALEKWEIFVIDSCECYLQFFIRKPPKSTRKSQMFKTFHFNVWRLLF